MTDPIRILVKRDELTLEGIKQFSHSETSDSKSLWQTEHHGSSCHSSQQGTTSTFETSTQKQLHRHLFSLSYQSPPMPVCVRNAGCLVIAAVSMISFMYKYAVIYKCFLLRPCDVQRLP